MTNRERMGLKFLVGVAFVAALVALCFPTVNRVSGVYRRVNCQSGIGQIGLGFSQYAQDYDGYLPLTTRPRGWVGSLHFYLKSDRIFQCPAEKTRGDDNLTDYWFNRRLAGGQTKAVVAPNRTLLAGGGEPSDDPNISLQLMPSLVVGKTGFSGAPPFGWRGLSVCRWTRQMDSREENSRCWQKCAHVFTSLKGD